VTLRPDPATNFSEAARKRGSKLLPGKAVEQTDRSDEQLAAEAAREGSDGPAFVEIMNRYRSRVWRICYRLMSNEQDASDPAQEVFVRLFLNRTKFAGRSKYATWVHAVAVRTCLTMRRGRGRRQKHENVASEEQWAQSQPTERETSAGLSMDLMQMLETLDEEDRAMLIMKYAEGHDYDELSEIFGISPSACKMRVSRAREKLQRKYSDQSTPESTPHGV
jgi:RNA polymerase sigma-70 factor (ECF subfamily)